MSMPNAYDALVVKQAELSGFIAKIAEEGRAASEDETGKLKALRGDIDAIKSDWETAGRKAFLAGFQPVTERKLVLNSSESFADQFKGTYDADLDRASISKYLRGYVLGDWSNAPLELKTMA